MRFYENPQKTSENRCPARSYYIPQNNGAYISLNGKWKFKYYKRDIDVKAEISDFDEITVPSCWQSLGYEEPNYTNVEYPFPVDPPYVPNDNPCGIYEREFTIDDTERKTYIVFEGISSCGRLLINGEYVGFTSGNHLQAEFDITPFVKKGINTVRVEVRKWCCGSYLEDQDCFRFNGIFRDVYLLKRPFDHITDVDIKTSGNKLSVSFCGTARLTLLCGTKTVYESCVTDLAETEVSDPVMWNAEKPFLYTLKIESAGEILEFKVGFRDIGISDKKELLINGTPVKLQGVNHHDTDMYHGWYQSKDELRRELMLMKSLNINAIRTSHYPPAPEFMDLCDELGFYVVLETDIETHGFQSRDAGSDGCWYDVDSGDDWPCNNRLWEHEFIQRMERAYERDKNHASVIMWSTGNESGHGFNHMKMIDYLRSKDSHRLIHCEDASRTSDEKGKEDVCLHADVYSRMYYGIESCLDYCHDESKTLPLFLCEYSHSMGNGPGDVCDYWDVIDNEPKFIGGCIWEWKDHTVIENGTCKYGGDWESELTNDGNFCCDGMLLPDLTLKAGTKEIKTAYQPLRIELCENGLLIKNRYSFTSLNDFELILNIVCDGKTVCSKKLGPDIEPNGSAVYELPPYPDTCKYGCFAEVSLIGKDGNEVAFAKVSLPVNIEKPAVFVCEPSVLCESGEFVINEGKDMKITISKQYGSITSIIRGGKELLASPVTLGCYRAPTDNERIIREYWYKEYGWHAENIDRTFNNIRSCETTGNKVTVKGVLAGVSRTPYLNYTSEYEFFTDGTVKLNVSGALRKSCRFLPRFGYEFSLNEPNAAFTYYGMGPGETYSDLNRYSRYGIWTSCAEKEYFPYIKPQEHGNHFGVRFLEFDCGMSFESDSPFEINVSNYSAYDIAHTRHASELKKDSVTHVRVDYKDSGIGSNSCGPELMKKYRFDDRKFVFCLRLKINN